MVGGRTAVLVTGAAGGVGGVGRTVVELLRHRDVPVRAMVHREDHRVEPLRGAGAEVVVGDLTNPADVAAALEGIGRMFFCMSVSSSYLEAAATVGSVAREVGALEVLVNLSQLTVSQMTAVSTQESHHQRLHYLAEQVLSWSGLPVVHVRPTIFLDNPMLTTLVARSVATRGVLPLPFGSGRTSPIAATDVARVVATILGDPARHVGEVYELTGPRSQDMRAAAEEYARALGRPVSYEDVPVGQWEDWLSSRSGLDDHLASHLATMARLHRENRYDRLTDAVERITGRAPQTVEEFVAQHAALFTAE